MLNQTNVKKLLRWIHIATGVFLVGYVYKFHADAIATRIAQLIVVPINWRQRTVAMAAGTNCEVDAPCSVANQRKSARAHRTVSAQLATSRRHYSN